MDTNNIADDFSKGLLKANNALDIKKIVLELKRTLKKNIAKDEIVSLINTSSLNENEKKILIDKIKMKPIRTQSGVTTVTVLTKPYACPGKCIFCPNDLRMPKSYIATEPGAQRALANAFSPYSQVISRLTALKQIGHPTEKIELLILGGTWSSYKENYQVWFVTELFRAMNDFASNKIDESKLNLRKHQDIFNSDINDEIRHSNKEKQYNYLLRDDKFKSWSINNITKEENCSWEELEEEQNINSTSNCRNVGLVFETRSDCINEQEIIKLRKFGGTKVQLGIQILNDQVSQYNERGETIEQCAIAFKKLRNAGFKIHAHMMPNLYMSNPEIDLESYELMFRDIRFRPDEMKIYPTSLIKNTKLFEIYNEGKYEPYSNETLIDLLSKMIEATPRYCRITRVIRDIPASEIEAGNKVSNLREIVENRMTINHRDNENIRAREIGNDKISKENLKLRITKYKSLDGVNYFLEYVTINNKIAGFLRLYLPKNSNSEIEELNNSAIIREVHVYGPSLEIGEKKNGVAQHLGLGTKLINRAKKIIVNKGFSKLAVISAIGTREYYHKRGFEQNNLYQIWDNNR